jgi:hypothetical protein
MTPEEDRLDKNLTTKTQTRIIKLEYVIWLKISKIKNKSVYTSSQDFKIFSSLFRMNEATSCDQDDVEERCSFEIIYKIFVTWIKDIKNKSVTEILPLTCGAVC